MTKTYRPPEGGFTKVAGTVGRGKSVAGPVVADRRPVCLRVDGPHVGHMSAVGPECREGGSLDAADAEAEALGHDDPVMFADTVGLTEAGACVVDNATGWCQTHGRIEA